MSSTLRKSDATELQTRGGIEHQRGFNPETVILLTRILEELQKINTQLMLMTDEEV